MLPNDLLLPKGWVCAKCGNSIAPFVEVCPDCHRAKVITPKTAPIRKGKWELEWWECPSRAKLETSSFTQTSGNDATIIKYQTEKE